MSGERPHGHGCSSSQIRDDTTSDLQIYQLHGLLKQEHRALLQQLANVKMEKARTSSQYNADDVLRLRDTWWKLQRADLDAHDKSVIIKETEGRMQVLLEAERQRADQMRRALEGLGHECTAMRRAIEAAHNSRCLSRAE